MSVIPLRAEPGDTSELTSQILYGEHFQLLQQKRSWARVRLSLDGYEGWIDNKQFKELNEGEWERLSAIPEQWCIDLVAFISHKNGSHSTAIMGGTLSSCELLGDHFEAHTATGRQPKEQLADTALMYLGAPYLWGGRTPFGIDCSGFTQMVYKLNGHTLFRDASQQATQGEVLSFLEESEPGDLAFFDNAEGDIIHVGILLKDNYIIHAHGKVRIDRIDHSGIFNMDTRQYSHSLRLIKRIL